MERKQQPNKIQQIDYSRQSTKMNEKRELTRDSMKSPAHRELTHDTLKSSGSTRSGTLSSRKSSAKTIEQDDEGNNQRKSPFNDQQQVDNCKYYVFSVLLEN
jgi:hypothetical protein